MELLDGAAVSVAPSKLMKIPYGFSPPPNLPDQVLVKPPRNGFDLAPTYCVGKSL